MSEVYEGIIGSKSYAIKLFTNSDLETSKHYLEQELAPHREVPSHLNVMALEGFCYDGTLQNNDGET